MLAAIFAAGEQIGAAQRQEPARPAPPNKTKSKECIVKLRSFVLIAVGCFVSVCSLGCSDAELASYNVSIAADQFEIYRRVVFYNGITDAYILSVEGYCSIEKSSDGMLEVTIKTENGKFLKHFLGLSDNVTFFAEQIQPEKVSTKNFRVIFKPSAIVPDVDIR
jgi:hypothetical protein